MAGNIIPAIATTNAITAGVCVLQAFKILRNDLSSARMVFLSRSAERIFSTEKLSAPNPSCDICGVARITLEIDLSRATLGDLVNYVRKELNYGDEISVLTDQLLFDPDFDDNVENELAKMGVKDGTFITVMDDNEEEGDDGESLEPRVNLVIAVVNKDLEEEKDPIAPLPSSEEFTIPRKQKLAQPPGTPEQNGSSSAAAAAAAGTKRVHDEVNDVNGSAKKRKLDDATAELTIRDNVSVNVSSKKGKEKESNVNMEVVELDDSGVIEID